MNGFPNMHYGISSGVAIWKLAEGRAALDRRRRDDPGLPATAPPSAPA
jgi:hypothetical protein